MEKINEMVLNSLWIEYNQNRYVKDNQRFGQYVFNQTGYETFESYHMVKPQAAFKNLYESLFTDMQNESEQS